GELALEKAYQSQRNAGVSRLGRELCRLRFAQEPPRNVFGLSVFAANEAPPQFAMDGSQPLEKFVGPTPTSIFLWTKLFCINWIGIFVVTMPGRRSTSAGA